MQSQRTATDWTLFAILTTIWAGAYAMTRVAVQKSNPEFGLPVEVVLSGRLTIGAVLLTLAMLLSGQRWPALKDGKRWAAIIGMGVVGMTLPFYLITTAQKTVDSSLAALYAAGAPLFVGAGAHWLFRDERMTTQKAIGILIGFAGVGVLFGPDAIRTWGSASVAAQFVLLLATTGYAAATLIARAAPKMPPLAFASGYVTAAALCSWPLLLSADLSNLSPNASAIAAVIGLGIGPSSIAAMLYLVVVNRAGANFLALTGYSIPIVSVVMGYIFFKETQDWNAVFAFALILVGVWLAQRSGPKAKKHPE